MKVYKSEKAHLTISTYYYNKMYILRMEQDGVILTMQCPTKERANKEFLKGKSLYKDLVRIK